jgi:ribosome-binding ATPase YchF (GTP1/OBG family)
VVLLCAQLEQEMLDMTAEERQEFLEMAGAEASGLELVIRKSFSMLDLISFFTFNERETRAWNIPRGTTAPQAAGAIHTDFERGFIRAEVIPFDIFAQHGSSSAVKAAGLMHLEGKEYVVQDGDVIYFRFNV